MTEAAAQRNLGDRTGAWILQMIASSFQPDVPQHAQRTFASITSETRGYGANTDAGMAGYVAKRNPLPDIFDHERFGFANVIWNHCVGRSACSI